MSNLLKSRTRHGESIEFSPMLLLLQAENLKNRGCGNPSYDYVDYYHDQYGNIYGFIDEIVITPDGSGSWGEDNWEDDFINHQYGDEYQDDPYSGGGGGTNNHTNSNQEVEMGREFINSFQNGDVNVQLTSEVLDGLSTMVSITGLVNTVAQTVKEDIGILGKIGSWLGGINLAYSTVSVYAGFTDGEISPKDLVNGAALFFSVGSYFVPALGFISIGLSVAACATPGDQGHPSGRGNY